MISTEEPFMVRTYLAGLAMAASLGLLGGCCWCPCGGTRWCCTENCCEVEVCPVCEGPCLGATPGPSTTITPPMNGMPPLAAPPPAGAPRIAPQPQPQPQAQPPLAPPI